MAKSIFVADDDATVRRMTRDPGNPFAYYFRNLQRKGQASRGNALFKHDPSVPDEALTDDYLALAAAHRRHARTRWSTGCARSASRSGRSGACCMCGHDWADAKAMRRSMELMAEKVLPRL